jgi:anti-sigma B factor antagonist
MCTGTQSLLSCHVERHGDAMVVLVAGEIDRSTEEDFAEALEQAMRSGTARVVVDLREVTFMGTTGLNIVIRVYREAERARADFRVINGTGVAGRTLRLAGVDQFLPVFPSLTEALAPA